MVVAEATETIEEGELVRLLAVPVEEGEWPSGVVQSGGEQGEAVRVVTQGAGFVAIEGSGDGDSGPGGWQGNRKLRRDD